MKIAIIGAHGVGKTPLAEALLENLPGYTMEIEPYYQLEASGHVFSEAPTAEDFVDQFNYSAELIAQNKPDVIFDRCVIDLLAYLHAIDPRRDIRSLFETAQNVVEEIDLIVFVAIEDPDLIPGHNTNLPKLRVKVNDILHEWVMDFGKPVLEVSGTLSERTQQVMARISSKN